MERGLDVDRMDPVSLVISEGAEYFSEVFNLGVEEAFRLIQPPPREEYGDLSFPLLRFLRRSPANQQAVVEAFRGRIWEKGIKFIDIEVTGGFLNIRFEETALAKYVFGLMINGWKPEPIRSREPRIVVVEHTSANPVHPLHMGHARNTSLGDTLARLLAARGHRVNRRFYVDDVGRQAAVAALGFRLLSSRPKEVAARVGRKPDHVVGWVYAVTHTALDAVILKSKLGEAGDDERTMLVRELDKLLSTLARLKEGWPSDLYEAIVSGVGSLTDPEAEVSSIMKRYEEGLEPERSLVREVAGTALDGFRETLSRMGVDFDAWDWESDLVWSGLVAKVIEEARRSPYHIIYKGTSALDIPRIVEELVKPNPEYRAAFKLPRGFEVPPLVLVRSDGTTLYTTRDIAYSIYKFRETGADRVVNVIGADQRLPQLQIRLALLGLGYTREALNMIHYDYEIVRLPGRAMSGRRGEYVTLDEVLDEARQRARVEVEKRNPGADPGWIEETAEKIAVGAVRFAMVQTSASKPIVFNVDKVLDLKENTAPYLQYTHARAHSILEKLGGIDYHNIDYTSASHPDRRRLLITSLRYPYTAAKAADDMAPEDLATYLLRLADMFNSWYQKDSVVRDPSPGARNFKAMLVRLVRDVLASGLRLLGVEPLKRM
ncbi:MAG: arginine--tRNA ligase [Desulfurococcales archaeon]|nr:arginine--tRNA ligase [Desulfurococcales archaeon]